MKTTTKKSTKYLTAEKALKNQNSGVNQEIKRKFVGGQAILLNYIIGQICADMGILEGQENSWATK